MTARTTSNLRTRADEIRAAIGRHTNTPERVGSLLVDIVDTFDTFAAPAFGAPAPALVATDNVTPSGVRTVDGVLSNAVIGDILLPVQTDSTQGGYWTPNSTGAWTRPSYYDSNVAVAASLGQLSAAALGGALNKGKRFYALSGSTLMGAKAWYPATAGAEINASDAPWYWLPDGTNRDTEKAALQAYLIAASAGGIFGTVRLGPGSNGYASTLTIPQGWSLKACGIGSELAPIVNGDPYDSVLCPGRANVGVPGYSTIADVKIKNPWGEGALNAWVAGHAYTAGQYVYPTRCSNAILKCTGSGTSGAFEPIGELSNTAFIKSVGTSLIASETLLIPVTSGALGSFSFKLSVNAGTTQSATQSTVVGDSQTFIVDTVLGTTTHGTSYGFKLANQPYRAASTTTTANFAQPTVYTTSVPASVSAQVASSAGFLAGDYVLGSTGGLWMVLNAPDSTHINLWNVGASNSVASGTNIPSGTTLTLCLAPAPRIEVLGTTPGAGWMVDVQMVAGPLGSAACQYQYSQGGGAERWKFGLTFGSGAWTNTTGGSGTWTTTNLNVPGATSLQLRFHTGLAFNNGTWGYMTPSQTWSEQVGTTVADNSCTWTICAAPACLRLAAGSGTIDTVIFDGGAFGVILDQCETVVFQGNNQYVRGRSASIWALQGSITNAITLSGVNAFYGGFVSIIHDGGLGFSIQGMAAFQGGSTWSMFLAGMDGVNLTGAYLEAHGSVFRNTAFFGRNGLGTSVSNIEIGGGYMGSVVDASTIDFYICSNVSIHGLSVGGTTAAFVGVGTCVNFNVAGCKHTSGGATLDAMPLSGHGFINEPAPYGTFYQRGTCINSSTPNRTVAGTTDTAAVTDSNGNVTCTSGSAVTVTVPTLPVGTVITYEQGGAGALSFTASGVTIQTAIASSGATSSQYQTRNLFWKDTTHVRIT